MTSKPTIFFSHSGRDKQILTTLKTQFCIKTGGTIDVFLSSDGSSISFGHNWQQAIQDALERCKVMFVFLSPLSVDAKWVYFESGFAYSRGVRVVPVALEGIDLGTQPPPLQLLQGFNLRGHEGLNNIISIVNSVFQHNHAPSFVQSDYEDLLRQTRLGPVRSLGRFAEHVENVTVKLKDSAPSDESTWLERLAKLPGSDSVIRPSDEGFSALGLRVHTLPNEVLFVIDRLAVDTVYPLVREVLKTQPLSVVGNVRVEVWLHESIHSTENHLRMSASLIGSEWTVQGWSYLRRKDGEPILSVTTNWYEGEYPGEGSCLFLSVWIDDRVPSAEDLSSALDMLFERQILLAPS